MKKNPITDMLSMLKESIFRVGEKKRLDTHRAHMDERESGTHADMLSKVHDAEHLSVRQQKVEHHGHNFWSYYFHGEHPDLNAPLPDYLESTLDDNFQMQSRLVAQHPLTRVTTGDGVGESEETIEKRWVRCYTVGTSALNDANYTIAEKNFRLSLDESEKLENKRSRQKALSSRGLGEALQYQGLQADADRYLEQALLLDEEILGSGDGSIEDEFYDLARHFVDEEKYEEVEKLFEDLRARLRMSVGRKDPLMVRCLNELAILYCHDHKWDRAEPLLIRAGDVLRTLDPVPSVQLAAIEHNYGSLLEASGRMEEAQIHYQTAYELLEQ